jgi:hypothetical protein
VEQYFLGSLLKPSANPSDEIYALEFESGTWPIDTPLLAELVLTLVSNGPGDVYFSGLGMIFRIMPYGTVAPGAGGGKATKQSRR